MPNHTLFIWDNELRLVYGIILSAEQLYGLTLSDKEAKELMEQAIVKLFYRGGAHIDLSIVVEALAIIAEKEK